MWQHTECGGSRQRRLVEGESDLVHRCIDRPLDRTRRCVHVRVGNSANYLQHCLFACLRAHKHSTIRSDSVSQNKFIMQSRLYRHIMHCDDCTVSAALYTVARSMAYFKPRKKKRACRLLYFYTKFYLNDGLHFSSMPHSTYNTSVCEKISRRLACILTFLTQIIAFVTKWQKTRTVMN